MSDAPLFILGGNGPYLNRGCEAIVRGTVNILRHQYNNPRFLCISHFNSNQQFSDQKKNEFDGGIKHLSSQRLCNMSMGSNILRLNTWKYIYYLYINKKRIGNYVYRDILPYLGDAKAVLSIGGDNYSLDYGLPRLFTGLDDLVLSTKKPLIIWGSSVGPFSNMPSYEDYMKSHLRKVNGIFARETVTIDYLKSIGVNDNVYRVADPAFLMNAQEPVHSKMIPDIKKDSIGLNFSPIMAKYVTNGNDELWLKTISSIIKSLLDSTGKPVYLIPHVTLPFNNDFELMDRAKLLLNKSDNVYLIPPTLNAAETKWVIGKMGAFVGARTHATIASISMGVPTLSLAYSIKAIGINYDIFGHNSYTVRPGQVTPDNISRQVNSLLNNRMEIRNNLMSKIGEVKHDALAAGGFLTNLI